MVKTLKTLFSFQWKYQPWFTLSVFFTVILAFVDSIAPFFYKLFIETITANEYSQLLTVAAMYIVVMFSGYFLEIFVHFTRDHTLIPGVRDARIIIFEHVQQLDFVFHTNKSTGALISTFKRGDSAFWELSDVVYDILRLIIQFSVMLISFWLVNSKYTLVALGLLGLNFISMRLLIPHNVMSRFQLNDEEDKLSGHISDNFLNYDTVKLFAKEDREIKQLSKKYRQWTKAFWRYSFSFRLIDFTNSVIAVIGYSLVLYFLVTDLQKGALTTGQFILVLGFLMDFFRRMNQLFFRLRSIFKNYADIERYFKLLEESVEVADPEKPKKIKDLMGEIKLNHVTFSYDDDTVPVLKDINLHIRDGESVALVGRSGSGKTTLMKLLLRFYDPKKGTITLDGVDLRDMDKSYFRGFFGVVPQEPILFNNTVSFNIGYGLNRPTQQMIRAAAKMANLDAFIESLPKKYNTIVGERGIKLSGGQKQRLAIARMILSNPEIIIFDEATSHLDSESEKLIQDAFWKVSKGKTTIIIAHRLSTVQKADRIIVLDKGKIVEEGTHAELVKKNNGHYLKLWQIQTEGLL